MFCRYQSQHKAVVSGSIASRFFFSFFIYLQIVYKNLVIFYKWEQIFIKKVAILLKEEEKNEKKKGGPAALSFYGE